MKRALFYIILGFGTAALAILALAETKPAPLPPPPIPDADRADFFQRQVELLQAQQALNSAQSAYEAAIAKLTADCGEKYIPQLTQDKKLVCATKAAAPTPPTPPTRPDEKK